MKVPGAGIASRLFGVRCTGVIVVLLLLIGSYFAALQRVEDGAFRLISRLAPEAAPAPEVALLALDEASLERLGPWPWSRQVLARGVDRLGELGVGTIGLMLPLPAPQTPAQLDDMSHDARSGSASARSALRKWVRRLDSDAALARALKRSGNVVLGAYVRPAPGGGLEPAWTVLKDAAQDRAALVETLQRLAYMGPAISRLQPEAPLAVLGDAAAAVAVVPHPAAVEGLAGVPLALEIDADIRPTFFGLLAARAVGGPNRVAPVPGKGVALGRRSVASAPDFRYYPPVPDGEGYGAGLHLHSFADLWREDANLSDLKGATVIVAPTAPGLAATLGVTAGTGPGSAVYIARALGALVTQTGFTRPWWFYGAQRAMLLALALLVLLPIRFHGRRSLALGGALVLLMLNGGLVVLLVRQVWLPVALPAVGAVLTLAILSARSMLQGALAGTDRETHALRLRYAVNLHGQDRLDEAFDEYRRCPKGPGVMEKIYQLGLDFERRRKLDRAAEVYAHLLRLDSKYRDVAHRQGRLKTLAEDYAGLAPAGAGSDTVLIADTKLEKPTMGPYRLEKQIGRGAMARVYLATDTKLDRPVALKVLSIRDDYYGDDLKAIEERFRREAEAEARMNHPNIVTVYEAGAHNDLIYIAMDYVDGTTLEEFTDPDNLLPVQDVVDIGIQAAQALDYAHSKAIIHRDVKPSNLLYMRESGFVKVSDFGIARISDDEHTRTGTILGTPSYMSPEQAVGKKIDGRSDLFSLGTTLYQLLAGRLPFTGDSVPTIMYQITKETHRSLYRVRAGVTKKLSGVIDAALAKKPERRYQTGLEMAEALETCRKSAKGRGSGSGKRRRGSRGRSGSRTSAA